LEPEPEPGTGDPFRFCWSGARLSACRDREL
jgi:hypothetical protein